MNQRYQMHDIIKAKGAIEAKKEIALILERGFDINMIDQVHEHWYVMRLTNVINY